jgi:hypothetical protein
MAWWTAQAAVFLVSSLSLIWLLWKGTRVFSRSKGRARWALALTGAAFPALCFALAFCDSRLVNATPADGFGSMLFAGAAIQLVSSALTNGCFALLMGGLAVYLAWQPRGGLGSRTADF